MVVCSAAQWGIGRYLYYLPEHWAIVRDSGRYYWSGEARTGQYTNGRPEKIRVAFNWTNPSMPDWALPGGSGRPSEESINPETGEVANSQFPCPNCTAPVFDHREAKKGTKKLAAKKPDFSCSNPNCRDPNTNKPWAAWLDTWCEDLLKEVNAAYGAELIDLKQQDEAEQIILKAENIRTMLRLQARMNELAQESA